MKLEVNPGPLRGSVLVPGSKSHTIRALLIGSLAAGKSRLLRPLRSADTESCAHVCRALGADVRTASDGAWEVGGTSGRPRPAAGVVDVGNSGTTLSLAMTVAALADGQTEFTGDEQIRRRPVGPLLEALRQLGATARSLRDNGCAPLVVGGPLRGGHVTVECHSSQYLSSLLLGCPLAPDATVIEVPLLNERPYVRMTMDWLQREGIAFRAADDLSRFELPGGQSYPPFERAIPADFSSATFFLVAAAVTGSTVLLKGLDMGDVQGDKAVVGMVAQMGCQASETDDGLEVAGPRALRGARFDLNATPDALPSLAVAGCFAAGKTELLNVPQARQKETDRLAVMTHELRKMGGEVEELDDGLVVRHSPLRGAQVDGHGDHRVVMALAVAGLAAEGRTVVAGAEAAAVTFPNFVELMQSVGAQMHRVR